MSAPLLLPAGSWRWMLRWRTDVIQAADGTEQRASTSTLPRVSFAGSFLLTDAQAFELRTWLAFSHTATTPIAQPHEAAIALAAVTGVAVTIDDTYCDWIAVGRRVLIVGAAGSAFTTTIDSFTGGALTLAAGPSSGTYPAGVTHVYPCEDVWLEDGQQVSRRPVALSTWSLAGRQQTAAALTGTGGAAVATYAGYTVLAARPMSDNADGEEHRGDLAWADAGGAVSLSSTRTMGARIRAGTYLIRTAAERQGWKVFLTAVRGRWKAFLSPTWRPDLPLYEQPTPSSNTIRSTANFTSWDGVQLYLQIEFADGTVTYRTVGSSSWTGAYSQITLTASLPGSFGGGSVAVVSFLEVVRLADDDVLVEYRGDWIGWMTLPVVTLQPGAGEEIGGPPT